MTSSQVPEFLHAFRWAVVRLATHVSDAASEPRLLFATVSLLTEDRPRPTGSKGVEQHHVGGKKHERVFFRRAVLSADAAVEWYRSASSEALITPVPTDPEEVDSALDGKRVASSEFVDDPAWPALGVPVGSDLLSSPGGPGDPAPFIGIGPARIHRRFGDNAGFDSVTSDQEVIRFLKRRLHVDLGDYTEYLGSLALIVPDPVLRRVQQFIVPGEAGEAERLVYRLLPRAGQTVDDLSLTVLERRSNLLSRFQTIAVPSDGLIVVPSKLPVQASGYAVSHPTHGVLSYQAPLHFIRSIRGSIGVAGRKVKIEAPKSDSPRSETDSYEVTEYGHEMPINVGDATPAPAPVRVIEAETRRDRRATAKRYKQTWFNHGERSAALAFLRGEIAGARSSVMVADPYFGAAQILQFLHAVPRTAIDFTILTSRLAFESEHSEQDGSESSGVTNTPRALPEGQRRLSEIEVERITKFSASMATLEKRGIRSASALVLSGKTPPLHDRFLVIDSAVWFLGNSLNALGDRASLILQVPDSEPILARLQSMQSRAVLFEDYAERRRKALSARAAGG